jgi:hypothetical protein
MSKVGDLDVPADLSGIDLDGEYQNQNEYQPWKRLYVFHGTHLLFDIGFSRNHLHHNSAAVKMERQVLMGCCPYPWSEHERIFGNHS